MQLLRGQRRHRKRAAQLRAPCRRGNHLATVTLDGQPVPLAKVQTGLLQIQLPEDNIFGLTGQARSGSSVADGWVAILRALSAGQHTIRLHAEGTINSDVTTTIIVL